MTLTTDQQITNSKEHTTMTTTTKEIERTYKVALDGSTVLTVRLRYTPGEEPRDRIGEQARKEAVRRAVKIAAKRNITGDFDLACAGVSIEQESLVDARPEKPLDLTVIATPKPERRPKERKSSKVGRNGWDA